MKFQSHAVAALALVSGCSAFCPAPVVTTSRPAMGLAMTARPDNDNNNMFSSDLKSNAMSFLAASVVAASTATVILPVAPAHAGVNPAPPKVEKVDLKKLPTEERNKIVAKKNLDLAEQTLKEYEKYVKEGKSAEAKAETAFKAQDKVVTTLKKLVISDSDKLSAAKNAKLPQTTIKELTTISTKSKESLRLEEKKLGDLSKELSKAQKELKSAEGSVKQSKDAIKSAKSKYEKATKELTNYEKKVAEQKKKQAEQEKKAKAEAQKLLREEEAKLKKLEDEKNKLEALKQNSLKELENKAKLIEIEKKNLQKMKAAN